MRKRITSLLLAFVLCLSLLPGAAFAAEGTPAGTEDDPILISSAQELKNFAQRVNNGETALCAKLMADIVLNDGTFDNRGNYTKGDSGKDAETWTPIGYYNNDNDYSAYEGTFDGGGHTIKGLYVPGGNIKSVGLFGCTSGATIQNVAVTGFLYGHERAGGIVGLVYDSATITNCINHATVWAMIYVGGIIGSCRKAEEQAGQPVTLTGCFNTGVMRGGSTSGLVGSSAVPIHIIDCGNIGALQFSDDCGGIICDVQTGGTAMITNCYSAGKTTKEDVWARSGGLVGYVYYDYDGNPLAEVAVTNSYWLDETADYAIGNTDSTPVGAVAQTADKFADGTVLNALKNGRTDSSWGECGYLEAAGMVVPLLKGQTADPPAITGQGTLGDPYLIYTASGLKKFRDKVNAENSSDTGAYVKLMADIDLSGETWTPIDGYTGTFDGDMHTITLGTISAKSNCGLFATLKGGASVKNLTVAGTVSIENPQGDIMFGAIAGAVESGATLLNCCSKVDYTRMVSDGQISYGGLVGRLTGDVLNSMYNNVASGSGINGIAAVCEADSKIINCCVTAPKTVGIVPDPDSTTRENNYIYIFEKMNFFSEDTGELFDPVTKMIPALIKKAMEIPDAAYWKFTYNGLEFISSVTSIKIADNSPTKDTLVNVVKGEPRDDVWFYFDFTGEFVIEEHYDWMSLDTDNGTLRIKTSVITDLDIENGTYTLTIGAKWDGMLDKRSFDEIPHITITVSITDKHNFVWTPNDDGTTHTGNCQDAGCTASKTEACADTDNDGRCDVCGRVFRSSRPSRTSYTVTVEKSVNGAVTTDRKTAAAGTTVTITVTPDEGYTLETLTVLDKDGNELKLTDKGDGKYTFTMPASSVTVKATFMDDNTMLNFFADVKSSAYYYDAVLWAAQNGITSGTDAVHFSPDQPCTRAQIVTFLWRAAGSPVVNYAMHMTDVPEDAYYAEAVRWALSEGITTGTTATTFSPNETCTRAQAVAFLFRYTAPAAVTLQELVSGFSDAASVPGYALPAMNWALAEGIVQGDGSKLMPNDFCTRAQIVTFLYRALEK